MKALEKVILLSAFLSGTYSFFFKDIHTVILYTEKSFCVSLSFKKEGKISQNNLHPDNNGFKKKNKQTIRRVLKLGQKCSVSFLFFFLLFFFFAVFN